MEHKISVLFTKLHEYNDVHEDGIWLDTEDVDCSSASVDKELATHDTSSINELFDDVRVAVAVRRTGRCS